MNFYDINVQPLNPSQISNHVHQAHVMRAEVLAQIAAQISKGFSRLLRNTFKTLAPKAKA